MRGRRKQRHKDCYFWFIAEGPFAETHEQLGGYILIEVNNFGDAIAVAKQIPSARTGTVEVRPLVERAAEANA